MVWQCHLLARKGSTGDLLQEEVILMTDLSGQTRWDSLALLNPGKTWQVENSLLLYRQDALISSEK